MGCSPRLAGVALPGFCRGCKRRMGNLARTKAAAACAPGRFLVAFGARRGEHHNRRQPPRVKTPPQNKPQNYSATPPAL